jgi:hypothetical protein
MESFWEIFFGKRKTPTEILAEIAKEARNHERVMTREAKRADKESLKAFGDAQKWAESAWPFEMKEGQLQSCYLMAKQCQDRGRRFAAQAAVLRDFATMITITSSNVSLLKSQLRSSSVIGNLTRMLPSVKQLHLMTQWFELSASQQELIQSELGDAMKEMVNGIYENGSGGELADAGESAHDWVKKKMSLHRIEAGLETEDADELLAKAPKVLPQRGRSLSNSTPVGVSSSAPGPPRPPGDDAAGDDE